MRILLVNQSWFAEEFRAAGHEVVTYGYADHMEVRQTLALLHIDTVLKFLPAGFVPDCMVFYDNSAPIIITGLEETSIPTLFYSVDTHHHYAWHKYLAHIFDTVLVAQKDYISEFENIGASAEWMPLWASRFMETSAEKEFGAVFVGTMNAHLNPDRVKFFEALKQNVEIFCHSGDFIGIFPKSELVVNQTVKGDLNFRVFEAMMSGAALLTERCANGLDELFQDGTHLVTYEKGNVAEAAGQVTSLLADKANCRRIGEAGRNEILAKHLPIHRAGRILEILSTLKKRPSAMRYFASMSSFIRLSSITAEKNNELELPALAAALKAAETGIQRGENLPTEIAGHAIVGCLRFDVLARSNSGEKLIQQLVEAHPEMELLKLAQIRNLLNHGQVDSARTIAETLMPGNPQEAYKAAELVIGTLFDQYAPTIFR